MAWNSSINLGMPNTGYMPVMAANGQLQQQTAASMYVQPTNPNPTGLYGASPYSMPLGLAVPGTYSTIPIPLANGMQTQMMGTQANGTMMPGSGNQSDQMLTLLLNVLLQSLMTLLNNSGGTNGFTNFNPSAQPLATMPASNGQVYAAPTTTGVSQPAVTSSARSSGSKAPEPKPNKQSNASSAPSYTYSSPPSQNISSTPMQNAFGTPQTQQAAPVNNSQPAATAAPASPIQQLSSSVKSGAASKRLADAAWDIYVRKESSASGRPANILANTKYGVLGCADMVDRMATAAGYDLKVENKYAVKSWEKAMRSAGYDEKNDFSDLQDGDIATVTNGTLNHIGVVTTSKETGKKVIINNNSNTKVTMASTPEGFQNIYGAGKGKVKRFRRPAEQDTGPVKAKN